MFDPPHLGHFEIARQAYKKIKNSKVVWIPSKSPPHRNVSAWTSYNTRFEMLKCWLNDYDEFEVSDIESKKNHSGYSVETVEIFSRTHCNKRLYLLIGSDEAVDFIFWKDFNKILAKVTLIIGKRKTKQAIPPNILKNAILLDNRIYDISSSKIRKNLKENIAMNEFLDMKIMEYIKKEKLYIENAIKN